MIPLAIIVTIGTATRPPGDDGDDGDDQLRTFTPDDDFVETII